MKDKFTIKNLNFWYGDKHALKGINLSMKEREVTALIGPSGCGKTTFLRCMNRMHDLYPGNRYEGEILLDGKNLLEKGLDLIKLRSRVGMVFQKPTPFPMSMYDNIAFGLKLMGVKSKSELTSRVEKAGPPRSRMTPNEVKSNRKTSTDAAAMAGSSKGRVTVRNAKARPAPRTWAACT